jgi:hypothetical protein
MFSNAYEALRTFFAMRGARVVQCPETHQPAGVVIDAFHAGWTIVRGNTELRLRRCSRWPEKSSCARECVRQIQAAPAECLVKSILTAWYEGKKCVFCEESLNPVDWRHHKPALMRPDGTLAEWCEFRPEQIPSALETHLPVCWDCYVEETFRAQHPELYN